jgi:hypothetical protein
MEAQETRGHRVRRRAASAGSGRFRKEAPRNQCSALQDCLQPGKARATRVFLPSDRKSSALDFRRGKLHIKKMLKNKKRGKEKKEKNGATTVGVEPTTF